MPAPPPLAPRDAATRIVKTLRQAGHVAYFAGGCVRDELLGLTPKDYDVATDATPARVGQLFARTQEVGASFGVVIVRLGGQSVEVATFRSDGPYSDRRRPDQVTFSDPRSDALRRDFTVNALFLDPLAENDSARVVDYVSGVEDLRKRVIRAVGDADRRLEEDHLRALRAVRLSARLGFTIEEGTEDAIRRHASSLQGVSRERIGDEVRRMLLHPARGVAAWTLQYLGLDAPVLQEAGTTRAPVRLSKLSDDVSYGTALAAWVCDRMQGEPSQEQVVELAGRWRKALCLSNDERDEMAAVLRHIARLSGRNWWFSGAAVHKRQAASPGFSEAVRIIAATKPEEFVRIRLRVEELKATPSGLAPMPFVTGDDLTAWGFRPGPPFKTILDRVYDAQLEDRVADRTGAEALARELARELGVEPRES